MASRTCGPKREAEYRAKVILELAGDRSFDGPVAGIVDARSHLIGEQPAVVLKELDGQNADVFQGFEDTAGSVFCSALDTRLKRRSGCERQAEDTAAMVIFDEGVKGSLAAAGTDGKNRDFSREGHKALEDELYLGKLGFGARDVIRGAQNPLAFAVIAHTGSL